MKYFLLIISFVLVNTLLAQLLKPIGIANSYILTEADGFPGFNYSTHAQFNTAGKIYIKDFFGNFHITGNNFTKQVPGLGNIENSAEIFFVSETEIWIRGNNGKEIKIIKNDSLIKSVEFPYKDFYSARNRFTNSHYQFKPIHNKIEIYKFIADKWVFKNKANWDSTLKIVEPEMYYWKNKQFFLTIKAPQNKEAIYLLDTTNYKFKFIKLIPTIYNSNNRILYNSNWQINKSIQQSLANYYTTRLGKLFNAKEFKISENDLYFHEISTAENTFIFNFKNGFYEYGIYDSTHILPNSFVFETSNKLNHIQQNPNHPSFLAPTSNKPLRIFPYIKKYPYLFNNKNSTNIFALTQDDFGRIWAGSYENNLSIIKPTSFEKALGSTVTELPNQPYRFMNAAINYNHKLYFVGETSLGGILQYGLDGKMNKLKPQIPTGFYLFYAPLSKTIWMPSAEGPNYPIYSCNATDLEKPFINWQKLDSTVGITNFGFSTMCEDTMQRIWIGHPKKGFAVYNQKSKKAITYDLKKNKTPIGFISCVTDNKGTVFMGSDDKGLWYYNDYTKPPTPANIHNIYHPLINNTVRITAMAIYKNWLVLSCYNKICLVNLDSFYLKQKAIVRYLTVQETNFTSFTEQNTMLVSKTDSTLWFSTSDMLYQWDINTWLQIPSHKVSLTAFIQKDSLRTQLNLEQQINLKPSETSFDLMFEYLSPDGLPHYTRTALVKQGDSLVFSEPNLKSKFSFKNLSSGNYKFYIEIFEQDGSTTQYLYQFTINKYLWQHWWFWVLASFLFLTPLILWLNSLRKQAVQQKIISQLNIITLSSQFRPHFILNALNTIGADLMNKPAAETVISRLGESINLIFNQAQKEKITHSLKTEWILVENVIAIHRIMYLPELQVQEPDAEWLDKNFNIQIPVGIIEIMAENALLHGLRNRKNPPYILKIEATDDEANYYFTITDNGIGRTKAMQLSSYKKHGTGTKNLDNIINILNKFNKNKIEIKYTDNVFSGEENCGTSITIIIPKNYFYEY